MAEAIDRPLLKIVEVFEDLEAKVNSQSEDLEVGLVSHGFILMLPFLPAFGFAFKFVEIELSQKVFFLICKKLGNNLIF